MDLSLGSKIRAFAEEEFFSEPRPGLFSSPKLKLGTNLKAFGWTKLWKSKTLVALEPTLQDFNSSFRFDILNLVRSKILCISI